ncbi:hypothetical protein ACFYUD_34065 [Nocardia tengchongensis]|uniref:hypothetical protein n=1 Tax=Nocardia tengchongensis TaxID=2055889 RepID=UPI0036A929D0
MVNLDVTRLPRGVEEWREFVEALKETDDSVESDYLELKSDIDLRSKEGKAKVTKFVLGVSNRMPEMAQKHLDGHAVMVLGVAPGAVPGIQMIDSKDLRKFVTDYTRSDVPRWWIEQVMVGGSVVLVVVVDPPKYGDPIWVSHKTLQLPDAKGNMRVVLADGGVYYRPDSETRAATGEEIVALCRRILARNPKAALRVEIIGAATRFTFDTGVLEEYVRAERHRLCHQNDRPGPITDGALFARLSAHDSRSWAEFEQQVQSWEDELREAWPRIVNFCASAVSEARIRITHLDGSYLNDVDLTVHLPRALRAFVKINGDYAPLNTLLPNTPMPWGAPSPGDPIPVKPR